jgi:regulator of sirC expression with transglutaminase-like and TPR domain
MERRKGIPITLSLLYFTLALRLDIPIFPVGMPYHFLVKYEGEHEEFYIDPFYGGIILTEEECYARMNQAAGHTVAYDSAYLRITPKRILLYRLLNNLKQIYFTAENWRSAEIVLKQLLIILPESYPNLRDLGKIALREHRYPDAIQWLQQYLDAEPNAPDAAQVLETMVHAHRQHLGRN